jgi:hypothetical protein
MGCGPGLVDVEIVGGKPSGVGVRGGWSPDMDFGVFIFC